MWFWSLTNKVRDWKYQISALHWLYQTAWKSEKQPNLVIFSHWLIFSLWRKFQIVLKTWLRLFEKEITSIEKLMQISKFGIFSSDFIGKSLNPFIISWIWSFLLVYVQILLNLTWILPIMDFENRLFSEKNTNYLLTLTTSIFFRIFF